MKTKRTFEQRAKPASKPGLKMKDLVEVTGLTKSTILFYLAKGLLPAPVKTAANMAYYSPETIERLRLIRHLQKHHRLTIAETKQVIESEDNDLAIRARVLLNDRIFGGDNSHVVDAETFCRETGLQRENLNQFLSAGLLSPIASDGFDDRDIEMGKVLARAVSIGFDADDLAFYVDFAEQLVDREMALRQRVTQRMPTGEDAATTLQMLENAKVSRQYVIERAFARRVAQMRSLKDNHRE